MKYSLYHEANFNNPEFSEVLGLKFIHFFNLLISAKVSWISPGCIGFIFFTALEPNEDSNNSIKSKKYLIYVLKHRNRVGNPIGFDISIMKKFKKINGDVGAKFMVKRLKKETKFIKINNLKSFKDFDKVSDFRT